ncbi:MAG: trimethylamine methyltransferase family protein [Deltaproteobacteria bacterium]|nr:trimethylamine methyltransferase family protein [Deltaproteobacteria bacterium]
MIESNAVQFLSPQYRRLSETQLRRIHEASLEILEHIGVRLYEEEAVILCKKAGMDVVDGNLVYFPSWRVEWALGIVPKQIVLYDQEGTPRIRLSGQRSYYGNGSDLLFIIDHHSGIRRKAVFQDVRDIIWLLDALPGYDFVMSGFLPSDVPTERAECMQMLAMLENTKKPIIYVTTNLPRTQEAIAMAEMVAGGAPELRRRPFAVNYVNISGPLKHNSESLQKLLWLAEKNLPVIYRPAIANRGLSAPITAAGFLAMNNAAALAGVVLSQLKREGAPFLRCSCAGGTFDMKTMVGLHSAPEIRGFNEELAHFYRMPCFGLGGTTDAKAVDQQAALEAALTLMSATLSGAQLIHDVGYMESGLAGSHVQLFICHEIIQWLAQYMKGLIINEETLALDIIEKVGPEQSFLDTDHTYRHFREDHYPVLLDRRRYDEWAAAGSTSLADQAKEKVDEILTEHPPRKLPESTLRDLRRLAEEGLHF